MAVYSDGSYGIQEGLIFSFPVTIKDGKVTIVKDLPVSDFSRYICDVSRRCVISCLLLQQ